MNDVARLQRAIKDLHGLDATHVRSEPVHETFRGETVWEGDVEVFALQGHPKATTAYAWSHETDEGKLRHVAVLELPPIKSAVDAVRAAIVAQQRDA